MNISRAVKTFQAVSENLYQKEDFPIANILNKINSVLQDNPQDKTACGLANFLQKKAENQNLFVSRAELKKVYNDYFSPNSDVKDILAPELGTLRNIEVKKQAQSQNKFLELKDFIDPALSHGFEKLAAPQQITSLDRNIAEQCQNYCRNEIRRFGLDAKIIFAGSQPGLALCQASFSSPKGFTNLLIPVEVIQTRPLIPEFFLCNSGMIELNEKNLKFALQKHAGEQLQFSPKQLLTVFASAKNNLRPVSEVEKIVLQTKIASAKTSVGDNVVGLTVENPKKVNILEAPEVIQKQAQSFGQHLSSPHGQACLKFGENKIKLGYKLINQSLENFGYKSAKIEVSSSDKNQTFYQVCLPGMELFKVPVKMANHLEIPNLMLSELGLTELTQENIARLAPSLQAVATYSPLKDQNDSQLQETIYHSMLQKNASVAVEALQILEYRKSPLYQSSFQIYLKGMSGKLEETQSKCSMPIKIASSTRVMCGHLRVPLDQVYQDETGQCCHFWRKHVAKPEAFATAAHRIVL